MCVGAPPCEIDAPGSMQRVRSSAILDECADHVRVSSDLLSNRRYEAVARHDLRDPVTPRMRLAVFDLARAVPNLQPKLPILPLVKNAHAPFASAKRAVAIPIGSTSVRGD